MAGDRIAPGRLNPQRPDEQAFSHHYLITVLLDDGGLDASVWPHVRLKPREWVPSLLVAVGVAACVITRSPVAPHVPPTVIYDISQLNPVTVGEIVAPATTE